MTIFNQGISIAQHSTLRTKASTRPRPVCVMKNHTRYRTAAAKHTRCRSEKVKRKVYTGKSSDRPEVITASSQSIYEVITSGNSDVPDTGFSQRVIRGILKQLADHTISSTSAPVSPRLYAKSSYSKKKTRKTVKLYSL